MFQQADACQNRASARSRSSLVIEIAANSRSDHICADRRHLSASGPALMSPANYFDQSFQLKPTRSVLDRFGRMVAQIGEDIVEVVGRDASADEYWYVASPGLRDTA